ncbi:MAG: sn-glycerol-3-phosphate ABC transporter ATP-binding protein UgpC [Candidatus Cloacimonetes bacterium]|nr:sn-glycerol-3-phosphate ABC transporter ATP-binding protein UgpC [Candidatus Cloacimonadota bacterium]MBL7085499.1 sn-glycerol-3-phosphate ABC transporter ATP-binding protein UgpC [Candidatus Cloacimonadota bacterium]
MSKVVLDKITKIYDNSVEAVKDVSLIAEDKEFVVLVGPSGCGKTTTLRMIAGLEEVSKGKIFIGDKFVNNVLPKDRDIAMVFQNYALYPHMSVYQNMEFGLKLRKTPKKEIHRRVEMTAELLGIGELLNRKPKQLSGGQRQRVALGRAIVRQPKVFLFDEPLSNLDAKLRVQMRAEIIKLHKKLQTTIIYVTHDQIEAMTMGDKIVVMKDGEIHQTNSPIHIYNQPSNKFVSGFIGSPAINFFDGKLNKKNGKLYFDEGSFSVLIPDEFLDHLEKYTDREITIGIRPEDIYHKPYSTNAEIPALIEAKVEVVEPLGSEYVVLFITGHTTFTGRLEPKEEPVMGEKIDIVIDMKKVHFFDPETELTVV